MYSQVGAGFQDYRLQHLQSGFSQKGFKHQNGYLLFGVSESESMPRENKLEISRRWVWTLFRKRGTSLEMDAVFEGCVFWMGLGSASRNGVFEEAVSGPKLIWVTWPEMLSPQDESICYIQIGFLGKGWKSKSTLVSTYSWELVPIQLQDSAGFVWLKNVVANAFPSRNRINLRWNTTHVTQLLRHQRKGKKQRRFHCKVLMYGTFCDTSTWLQIGSPRVVVWLPIWSQSLNFLVGII